MTFNTFFENSVLQRFDKRGLSSRSKGKISRFVNSCYGLSEKWSLQENDSLICSDTSVSKAGGFINKLTLKSRHSDLETRLIQKKSEKSSALRGFLVSSALEKFSFVPKTLFLKSENCGLLYEFKEGKPIEKLDSLGVGQVFDNLWQIYIDSSLAKDKDIQKVCKKGAFDKVQDTFESLVDEDNEFLRLYKQSCSDMSRVSLTHQDLHLGNVLFDDNRNERNVIDWDNANLSIPYADFYNLALTSGFVDSDECEAEKERFLSRQRKEFSQIRESENYLVEFSTCLNYISRFEKDIRTTDNLDKKAKLSQSLEYLVEKSLESLENYSLEVRNGDLKNSYLDVIDEFSIQENSNNLNLSDVLKVYQIPQLADESSLNYKENLDKRNRYSKFVEAMTLSRVSGVLGLGILGFGAYLGIEQDNMKMVLTCGIPMLGYTIPAFIGSRKLLNYQTNCSVLKNI